MQEKKQQKKQKESIDELKKDLEQIEKQKNDYLAGWQRAQADFINYKKQEIIKINELIKYSQEEFILNFLPVLDSFDLAEKKMSQEVKNDENIKGLMQIKNQILVFLKNQGVELIETEKQKFDPSIHEAVDQIQATEQESGTIIEEIQKGYKVNGRLLRSARVKIIK